MARWQQLKLGHSVGLLFLLQPKTGTLQVYPARADTALNLRLLKYLTALYTTPGAESALERFREMARRTVGGP